MTLEIRAGDFDAFFRTPFEIYPAGSPYVSPMRSDLKRYFDATKNPLLTGGGALEFFTAFRDRRPVGRITAHRHPASNVRHGLSRSYFGYLDAVDDPAVVAALLEKAEAFARAHGDNEVAGPFNLTAMQQAGLTTDGFEHAPCTDMVWSPPWLAAHVAAAGYAPFFPASTFEFRLCAVDRDALLNDRAQALLDSPDWTFAPIDRRDFQVRLEEARLCLNAGFDANPMFVPLSAEEFQFQAGEMMWVLDPALSAVMHHKGRPAGVAICIPDLNPFVKRAGGRLGPRALWAFLHGRFEPKRAVIILYSVVPEFQGRGVNTALLHRVVGALQNGGYATCGVTWIGDGNGASLRMMDKLGARRLHRTDIFRKALA